MTEQTPPAPRRPAPSFMPRFTIGLFYLVVFFFLFSFLQVLPDLLELLSEMQPSAAQERAAAQIARDGTNPLASLALSLLTTALGSWLKLLPGMRAGP